MATTKVEVLWFPKGWAPTTLYITTSIAAAERKARQVAKRMTGPGTTFIRIWDGPQEGERVIAVRGSDGRLHIND